MAYSPIMPNMKLTASDMGVPDYADALRKGFQTSADVYKPSTAASALLEKMLQNKINQPKAQDAQGWYDLQKRALSSRNMLYGAQAQQAVMDYMQNKAFYDALSGGGSSGGGESNTSGFGDSGYQDSEPSMGGQSGIDNSSNPGVSAEGPGPNYGEPTVANTFPGRTGRPIAQTQPKPYVNGVNDALNNKSGGEAVTLSPGNPGMYHIDDLYDKNPLARAGLEKRNLKKTQTVKLDPKTGNTSVITTYPSGKITVQSTGKNATGTPLTTKTISTLQLQKQAIPQLKKVIDDLIAAPSPFEPEGPYGIGKIYRADDRAKHQALVDLGRDIFVKAKGINATDTTLGTAKNVLDRRTGESDKSYHKRLLTFKDTLDNDEKDVDSALGGKSSTNKPKELTYNPATGRLE